MKEQKSNIIFSTLAGLIGVVAPFMLIAFGIFQGYLSKKRDININFAASTLYFSIPLVMMSFLFSSTRSVDPFSDRFTFIVVYTVAGLIFYIPALTISYFLTRENKN